MNVEPIYSTVNTLSIKLTIFSIIKISYSFIYMSLNLITLSKNIIWKLDH